MDDFATGYLAGQDGSNNNGGFFGNEGLWAVIILAIIFGWGNGGYGRNGGNDRYPYYPQEENRYIDPYPIPRYPDVENGRRMPQIGFSQNGDWDKRSGQYERGGADNRSIKMPRQHLTHDEAEEWCDSMVNADGTKGCHWTLEQTQDVAKQRNITCDPNDFWAVMNMMYSDYCQVAKRQSVDTPGFYADMAKAFLEDADAADGKAYLYWDCIADK